MGVSCLTFFSATKKCGLFCCIGFFSLPPQKAKLLGSHVEKKKIFSIYCFLLLKSRNELCKKNAKTRIMKDLFWRILRISGREFSLSCEVKQKGCPEITLKSSFPS